MRNFKPKIVIALILLLIISVVYSYNKNTINTNDDFESMNPAETFNLIDSQLLAINIEIDKEFEKLPKYQSPSKDQPISDALEFIKFTKTTLTSTMEQNADLLSKMKGFDEEVQKIIQENN